MKLELTTGAILENPAIPLADGENPETLKIFYALRRDRLEQLIVQGLVPDSYMKLTYKAIASFTRQIYVLNHQENADES